MEKTIQLQDKDFNGLCFVNLVDFDMLYGHRNDIEGYAKAATVFDKQLGTFMERMQPQDILMITADHGCDPGFKGTDHSRECVPFLAYGEQVKIWELVKHFPISLQPYWTSLELTADWMEPALRMKS